MNAKPGILKLAWCALACSILIVDCTGSGEIKSDVPDVPESTVSTAFERCVPAGLLRLIASGRLTVNERFTNLHLRNPGDI